MTEAEWLLCTSSGPMLAFLDEKVIERKVLLTECAFLRRFWHLLTDGRSRRAVEVTEQYAEGLVPRQTWQRARAAARRAFDQLAKDEQEKGALLGSFSHGCLAAAWHAAGMDLYLTPPGLHGEERAAWKAAAARSMLGLSRIASGAVPIDYPSTVLARWPSPPPATGFILKTFPPESYFDLPEELLEENWEALRKELSAQADLLRDLFGNPFRQVRFSPSGGTEEVRYLARHAEQGSDQLHFHLLADALEEAGCTDEALLSHCRRPGGHVRGCWAVDLLLARR